MNRRDFWLGLAVGTLTTCLLGPWVFSAAGKEIDPTKCLSPEFVAEYIHSVIQADRTFYQIAVLDRMEERGMAFPSEHWRADGQLPLPAQFLQNSGQHAAEQRNGIRFKLISSWAINKKNRPTTEFEQTGLAQLLVNPDRPYTGVTTEGGARVFQALYADKAVSQHCADCHNVHSKSPKSDFKAGDVMGGILITIPLPK
jgi:hypothetical protein